MRHSATRALLERYFFFQAEDGIRDWSVTGVQTCALPISMVEINPLVVTRDGQVLALDVKMSFDDNAMFRRPNVAELRDYAQEDPREVEAAEHGLNYVARSEERRVGREERGRGGRGR